MITKDYSPVDGDVVPEELPWRYEITNDVEADKALKQIKRDLEETRRIVSIAEAEKAELDVKIKQLWCKWDERTEEKRMALERYFDTVQHRHTKTTEKYDLLSGTLTRKKATKKISIDDESKLIDWLESSGHNELVSKKPKWGEVKKLLQYDEQGNIVVSDSGEVAEGVKLEDKPESFDINFRR